MQQANDFLEESRCLDLLVEPLDTAGLQLVTQFMDWTIEDIIGHLHLFNHAAKLALADRNLFKDFFAPMATDLNQGKSLLSVQNKWLDGTGGRELLNMWREGYEAAAQEYATADPKQRIAWAGPDMSARSSITARQMETWAHGQAAFDILGVAREDKDRIKNIVHLGINTYGWTFKNRNLPTPDPAPHIRLKAPSGTIWQWNEEQNDNRVEGSAVEFCQIVTQTRNVADTNIEATGNTATRWMAMAQCFAGPPVEGPKKGLRFMAQK